VTWKYAATLDGRSAAADGSSRWITGEASRADVHRLRAEADAVVAGVGPVLADDPLLDARSPAPGAAVQPCGSSSTPLPARRRPRGRWPAPRPALVVTAPLLDDPGYPRRSEVPAGADGRVDLRALLALLQDEHDVVSVLLEGGPTLAGAFVRDGLVDRVVGYVAPALLGSGRAALGDAGVGTISAAHRLQVDDVVRTGEDVRLTLRPARRES
jgi:diaminohydroxyphosphoribosylaminopyrimidine deaminase/5-amino-6-(5-phosphoribosylamino)uracil reductase